MLRYAYLCVHTYIPGLNRIQRMEINKDTNFPLTTITVSQIITISERGGKDGRMEIGGLSA